MKNSRSCTIATTMVVLIIAVIIFIGIYVNRTADYILFALEDLTSETTLKLRETAEFWEDRRKLLNLALSDPELDKVSSLFDDLIIEAEEGNSEEFKKTMARLRRAIEDIKELEEISLENIF